MQGLKERSEMWSKYKQSTVYTNSNIFKITKFNSLNFTFLSADCVILSEICLEVRPKDPF